MQVLSIGLNHTTAPVEVRERAAVASEHLDEALKDISKLSAIEEATILSTCNRTEIYCHVPFEQAETATNWLCDFHELRKSEVEPCCINFALCVFREDKSSKVRRDW